MGRLTKWAGVDSDGAPRANLIERNGSFYEILQPALRKLARFEDEEERGLLRLPTAAEKKLAQEVAELSKIRFNLLQENFLLRRKIELYEESRK